MSQSPALNSSWQRRQLLDIANRARELAANTAIATAGDFDTAGRFAHQALDLHGRMQPLVLNAPRVTWLTADADADLRAALLQVYSLVQTFLVDTEAAAPGKLRASGLIDPQRVAFKLRVLRPILADSLPAAVQHLHRLVAERCTGDDGAGDNGPGVDVSAVVLERFGRPILVRGQEKPALTYPQYKVVRALVEAGEAGLTKDDLESVNSDARGILRRLRNSDPDWRAVIHFAGKTGRRYRIG